jgi:hypothetical protein
MPHIDLGDTTREQAHDSVRITIASDAYNYIIEVSHPIHVHHLRVQLQVRRYYLLDEMWKLLRDSYARRRRDGAEYTSTEMMARQVTLRVVLRELLESGAGMSVGF